MKVLKRLLLIHWFYFQHEMIEFDRINFLTGKNSSGKSTIIDAMQLVLLGDTSGTFFNKAASGRGTRTLTGYLRGELGDDEDAGFRYLRSGRFTSYIALEFYDDLKNTAFTAGCCFDTFGENDCQKLFFRFDGPIPEKAFVDRDIPLSIEKLRVYMRSAYTPGQQYTTATNRDFREDLCGKLGGLQPRRFSELLKKAVSFNPNVDIQQFITEFVCGEEETVQVADMQESIRSYDSLRKEARLLNERLALLSQIRDTYGEFVRHRESETLYRYLIDRAAREMTAARLAQARLDLRRLEDEQDGLAEQITLAEAERQQLQTERDALRLQLDSNEDARRLAELDKLITEKRGQCLALRNGFERASSLLTRTLGAWHTSLCVMGEKIAAADLSLLDPALAERVEALCAESEALDRRLGTFRDVDAEGLLELSADTLTAHTQAAKDYRDRCKRLEERLLEAQRHAAGRRAELKREQDSLEKGIYPFPQDAIDLKEAVESRLRARFGPEARAVIVAEAAEVRDDRWRNTLEGYLHTQRFYVIVAPDHFYAAFQLFDNIKRQKAVYGTGLVDTERLQRMNPAREAGSLAEELDTDHPSVRLFLNYTLGRVQKCDNLRDLRKHRTAVTDDGVLYQNFVVHAMDPKRWRNPAIGQGAARLRLARVKEELARLAEELSVYAGLITLLRETDRLVYLSENETGQIMDATKAFQTLPAAEEALQRLKDDADSIDKSEIETLRRRFAERERALKTKAKHIAELFDQRGVVSERLRVRREETIPRLDRESDALQEALDTGYEEEWVAHTGGPRYERELNTRGTADEIYRAFPREQSVARNRKTGAWEQTVHLRHRYNEAYKMGYDINAPGNEVYEQLQRDYAENRLPTYEEKIADTRRRAFQQFQEDVLSRLQSNIRNARRQIEDLNAAMKNARFGEDIFRFRVTANPAYKRYYDMIDDEMLLMGGYNLLSEQFNAKYRDELTELFAIITNDGDAQNTPRYGDYEKRVQVFTDYRTYLNFDLEVIKPNGETERLSRTLGKKSGGETQTPFYIAVLSSFVQLYRVGRDKSANTARLILFDEAFSKMDGERIIQSIALLRRFNFQVVLAAPPDKIADIATLVDRNLGVLREGRKTCVRAFDPRQAGVFADEG